MADEVHGAETSIHLAGYDLSRNLRSADATASRDTADVTTFKDKRKRYIAGLRDGTFSAEGFWGAGVGELNEALAAASGETPALLSYFPEGDAIGAHGDVLAGIRTAKAISSDIGDAVKATLELQATGGVEDGVSLHEMGAEAASGNYAGVDHGAATVDGAVGYLHVPDLTGTLAVVIQDSVDGVTWVDLITFDVVNTDHAFQRVYVPGPVDRRLRAISTITVGPATFAVAAVRKPLNNN